MSSPGWYPDPGGQPGYRFWDGREWTSRLSTRPVTAGQPGSPGSSRGELTPAPPTRQPWRGWLVALAVAVAIVVVAVLAVRGLGGALDGLPGVSGGDPSADVCPQREARGTPDPQPNDGRVHSGPLSYPMLPGPWEQPIPENYVPFGRAVLQQFVETERAPGVRWGAAVMVGELVAGDGFFAPRDGAEIVLRCATGTFYGDAAVTRDDSLSQAMTVDGHDAWIMKSNLSFAVPGIEATSELLTVVIVDLDNGSAGLFASSVPGNTPQYSEAARRAMEGLRVN